MKKGLIINKLKKHFYVIILIAITLVFFSSILSSSKTLNNVHYINDITFQSENIRQYLHENGAFPLWTPYFYSGQPFIGIPEYYIFDLNFLYIFLFKNIFLSMNLAVMSYFFLAGLGMYFLVYEITKKRNAAFIASLIFMFNALMYQFILSGHLNILEGYALIPFVFLFTYKALHKKWLSNSILAALFLSMMIYAGGIVFFLYTGLIIGTYMVWNLIGKDFKKRFLKTILVSIIIITLLFGLSSLKLLPVLEFTEMSSRSSAVNYQEFLGEPITNLWGSLINVSNNLSFSGAIGIISFILLLFGLLSFRKKIVMFSLLLVILSILLAAGTFVASLLYQLPGFGQMRHIERALVMFVFIAPLIAAYGFINLSKILRDKNIKEWITFSIVSILLVIELIALNPFPKSVDVTLANEIPIVNEINKDQSNFRIATYALSTPIGASGYNYYSQLNIPAIKGGGGIWMVDYVQYLALAQQAAPSKMFGILNGKYLISDKEIDDPGLTLKETFQACEKCPIWEAYGPYLYENEQYIPQAFVIDNAVLVLGEDRIVNDFSYNLIIENLDPSSTVMIKDKTSVSEYDLNELRSFDSIVLLTGSLTQNDIPKLQTYTETGNIIPNILEGENTISLDSLGELFNVNKANKELQLKQISVNEYSININGEKGWLVLSERFAHFPGWTATIDGKDVKMYKADNVITALNLDGQTGNLIFKYAPDSFKKGKIITLFTILILLIYSIYKRWKK
jgi:hypothetical protein